MTAARHGHTQLVDRLLDDALGVLQIFELCRPVGDVHGVRGVRYDPVTSAGPLLNRFDADS